MEEKICPVDRERVLIGLECCREQDCIRCTYDCGTNEDFDRLLFDTVAYDWCFDGEPVGGIVAVSSVGTQANAESKRLFLRGYEEMMKRLDPAFVIFYGHVPLECDWNVIRVKPHYEEIVERRKNAHN